VHFIDSFGFDDPNLTSKYIVDVIVNILDKLSDPAIAYEIQRENMTTVLEKHPNNISSLLPAQ
jgi:hypothetical protein